VCQLGKLLASVEYLILALHCMVDGTVSNVVFVRHSSEKSSCMINWLSMNNKVEHIRVLYAALNIIRYVYQDKVIQRQLYTKLFNSEQFIC
jgi:hypothetical protein